MNREHVRVLQSGVEAWNEWRRENPSETPRLSSAHLDGAMLIGADLRRADLSGARLRAASLHHADLVGANLARCDLREASLIQCDLDGAGLFAANLSNARLLEVRFYRAYMRAADLRAADLNDTHFFDVDLSDAKLATAKFYHTILRHVRLEGADFTDAEIFGVTFANCYLAGATGLETVRHGGPSSVGSETLVFSRGQIPAEFLRRCGVPETLIQAAVSLARTPREYDSCFISYSTKDEAFVQRLYADLQSKGVRCWFFPEDAKWGGTVWGEIDRGIRVYDKLVVVCSQDSLQSPAVLREIERALQREDREKKNVLFPIRIDDYIFDGWEHERKADLIKKVIGDFRQWKDPVAYAKALERLLRDLKSETPKTDSAMTDGH